VAGNNAQDPHVAGNSNGDVAAAWVRSNRANEITQVMTKPAGHSWSAPVDLSRAGENADSPHVAVTPASDVYAIWDRSDGSNDRLQTAVESGGVWAATQTLSSSGRSANAYDLKVNSSGEAIAAWQQYDASGNYMVQVAIYTPGSGWNTSQTVSSATGQGAAPSVALDSAGDATVAWQQRAMDGSS
jgi:hypothetical protein